MIKYLSELILPHNLCQVLKYLVLPKDWREYAVKTLRFRLLSLSGNGRKTLDFSIGEVKGQTSRKMLTEFKELSKKFWGRHIGATGYFAASSGNLTDEVIMQYLESQDVEQRDDDFRIME